MSTTLPKQFDGFRNIPGVSQMNLGQSPDNTQQAQQPQTMPNIPTMPHMAPMEQTQPQQPVRYGNNADDGIQIEDRRRALQAHIQACGYVYGFIAKSGPYVTAAINARKDANGNKKPIVEFRNHRPATAVGVLLTLPVDGITRGSIMAEPSMIIDGNVSFNPDDVRSETANILLNVPSTISYLSAFGNHLPEYRPTIDPTFKTQWEASQILRGDPEVTHFYIKPSKAPNAATFRWLFSTTRKGSIYTRYNFVPLKQALSHSVKCSSIKAVQTVNEIAFGFLRSRTREGQNAFEWAVTRLPGVIWEQPYVMKDKDGKEFTVNGIGSQFFMMGKSMMAPGDKEIPFVEPTVKAWYRSSGDDTRDTVSSIVLREQTESKDKTKAPRWTIKTASISEWSTSPAYEPYKNFIKAALNYGTIEQFAALTGKTKSNDVFTMSGTALSAMEEFRKQHSAEINSAISAYSTAVMIAREQK